MGLMKVMYGPTSLTSKGIFLVEISIQYECNCFANRESGATAVAQQLRVLAAFAEDLGLTSRPTWWLTCIHNSCSRGSDSLFWISVLVDFAPMSGICGESEMVKQAAISSPHWVGKCLSYCSITLKRHHAQHNFYKRKHLIEGFLFFSI